MLKNHFFCVKFNGKSFKMNAFLFKLVLVFVWIWEVSYKNPVGRVGGLLGSYLGGGVAWRVSYWLTLHALCSDLLLPCVPPLNLGWGLATATPL